MNIVYIYNNFRVLYTTSTLHYVVFLTSIQFLSLYNCAEVHVIEKSYSRTLQNNL